MKNLLYNIVTTLKELNDYCEGKLLKQELLTEAFNDLSDFPEVQEQINNNLETLKNLNPKEMDKTIEKLISIHIELQNIVWHVDQVHEIVVETIKNYRKTLTDE